MIDILLCLVSVNAKDALPPIWQAWTTCLKKEASTALQEHIRDNVQNIGNLTTMLMLLSFNLLYEDSLESGLQPFMIS